MKFTLSKRIWASLIGILLLAVLSSGIALFSAWRTEDVYKDLISKNLEQARAISELEISWLEQGGLMSFYLLDGRQKWIDELHLKRPDFEIWLEKISKIDLEADQQKLLEQISDSFGNYKSQMDQVITLADQADFDQAKQLWIQKAGISFDNIYDLCEELSSANNRDIDQAIEARRSQIKQVNFWIIIFIVILAGTITSVFWSLLSGVFWPLKAIRERIHKDNQNTIDDSASSTEDIRNLGIYIDNLKYEVADMRTNLTLSQRRLIDAEKLASIGKLAAGVAHEIRSPLTSLKLRLYSLQKAFQDHQRQKDFKLVSEEITRLDDIVTNFLEFSRPRPLNLHKCRLDELLDKTLELMHYKLEAANITVQMQIEPDLPYVMADSQQLQQVFVNLLNNSIDVLADGGDVRISVQQNNELPGECSTMVLISDNGPGISYDIQDRIFEPFFGTKKDSTGLGLWIAKRIMVQHKGSIDLKESTSSGTIFALWIPV